MFHSTDMQTDCARVLKEINGLDTGLQMLLELLAVFYAPTGRTKLLHALNRAGERGAGVKAHTAESLHGLLEELFRLGYALDTREGAQCHPELAEPIARRALAAGRFASLAAIVKSTDSPGMVSWQHGYYRYMRNLRIALYGKNWDQSLKLLEELTRAYPHECAANPPMARILGRPFDAGLVGELPEDLMCSTLIQALEESAVRLVPQSVALKMAEEYIRRKGAKFERWMRFTLAEQYCLRGRWNEAGSMAPDADHSFDQTIKAWIAFLQGRDGEAIKLYEDALSIIRKGSRRRKVAFQDRAGQFYPLALMRSGDAALRRKAADYVSTAIHQQDPEPFGYFQQFLHYFLEELDGRQLEKKYLSEMAAKAMETDPINALIAAVILGWLGMKPATGMNKHLKSLALEARAAGYDWLAREAVATLKRLNPDTFPPGFAGYLDLAPLGAAAPLADAFKPEEPWERALAALDSLAVLHEPAAEAGKPANESRLTWRLRVYEQFNEIDPYEQRRTARGEWSAGRVVALKRLANEADEIEWLTPQDRKICKMITTYRSSGGYRHCSNTSYNLDTNDALPELAGHPLVFWADQPDAAVEVMPGQPELHVEQKEGRLWISLRPELTEHEKIHIFKESLTRVRIIPISPEHRRLAQIIGKGLAVPESARERVMSAMTKIAPLVSVHSQIGAGGEALDEIAADPMPHLLLMPAGSGFRAEIVVRPLGESGAAIAPGHGGSTLIADMAGRRVQARRDLPRERELAGVLENILAPLADVDDAEREIWTIADPENCLELLAALHELPKAAAIVEWPKGGRLSVSRAASAATLNLSVKSDHDWFSLSGRLQADENLTIEMRRLLELLDAAPGRFIPLGEGQYLTLTRELRRRLEELRALAEAHGKGLRIHAAAVPAVAELAGETGAFKTDKAWRDMLERIREAQSLQPCVPSTLKAELRDYQQEGFTWLSRLAHWGAGACLADDMGLGKTVQALAVLLDRAKDGPALVVAPTSVCLNWAAETERFAPTLNVKFLGGAGPDRRTTIESIGPFDLLVTSYDLMHREEELLSSRRWRTIILDEAQAIKNMTTRRSRAAMKIHGDFRMITTGTPIENHLGEIWNLFRFLNPGLLGSLERFNRRFAEPIERREDRAARGRLKKLLHPFILRRMRAQVLEELPPRTEIVMDIESGAEEAAFYEALRRVALNRLEREDGAPAQRRFQILAEIMRLRRACCNPRLVIPDTAVASAKLDAFGELVDKLREGGHKALVFSQFTDHLAIMREFLDKRGVEYQYLDGTMPADARQRAATAFQNGCGDLFLISLKAGGTGLNLTAADYVIHLDPWWNPAVEDQATGRAHRMGQDQPVTVYRLVLRGTIEQKIMDLHRHKRDLADSLLEGADSAVRLTPEELMNLLRNR